MKASIPPSFGRAGRPRRINYADLFLWEPILELELSGTSSAELFGENDQELLALFHDIGRRRKISLKRAQTVLPAALESLGFPLRVEVEKALRGEPSLVNQQGLWGSFLYGGAIRPGGSWPPKLGTLASHIVDIELALVEPTHALKDNNFRRCADLIDASSVLSKYLWPEIIAKIRNATSQTELLEARFFVSLEMQLSWTACIDAQLQANGHTCKPMLHSLFPDFNVEPVRQPNTLFFDWLAEHSGAGKSLAARIPQISKPASEVDISSSKRQLRRWRSGSGFPSFDVLDALFRNLYGDKAQGKWNAQRGNWVLSWTMAMATKRISFLMALLMRLNVIREPVFPFGCASVQEWRENRYLYWYRHWLPLLVKQ